MDDLWQLKGGGFNRASSSQRFPSSGTFNQSEVTPGQFSHPYVAQEVCVIERTIRQEPVPANHLNYGAQSINMKGGRQEFGNPLLALLSGSSQQLRSSFQQSPSSRSSFLASNSQLYQMSSSNPSDIGGWSLMSSSSIGRASGLETPGSVMDLAHVPQGRDLVQVTRTASIQDSFDAAVLRSNGPEVFKQALSMSSHENEADMQGQSQYPQWLAETRGRRQIQRVQNQQGVQRLATLQKTSQPMVDSAFGVNNQQNSGAAKAKPQVYCQSSSGSVIGGQLKVTDSGRLGVLCLCHNEHMSITKFTEHAGVQTANPGSNVYMESGENLIQWRRAFFSEFGVKVPEDHVGWDWNSVNDSDGGHAKHKALMTQSWQKEGNLSHQSEPFLLRSRAPITPQLWDSSVGTGNPHDIAQGPTNMGLVPSNLGQKFSNESRDMFARNFYNSGRTKSVVEFGLNPPLLQNIQENIPRNQEASLSRSFRNGVFGAVPDGECIDFIKNGTQPYTPAVEQQMTSGIKNIHKAIGMNRLNHMQALIQPERENLPSSFELRLGQPSQNTPPLGASFSPCLGSQLNNAALDRNRSLIYERFIQRVWDENIQRSMQRPAPGRLANFIDGMEQTKELFYNEDRRNDLARFGSVDMSAEETNVEHDRLANTSVLHPARQFDRNTEDFHFFPGLPRLARDNEQLLNRLPVTASCMTKSSPVSQVPASKTFEDQNRLGVCFNTATPSSHFRNDVSIDPPNALNSFQRPASVPNMKQNVGGQPFEDGVRNASPHCFPSDSTFFNKISLPVKGPGKVVSSALESISMKGGATQTLVSSFETCDSSQALWPKRGLNGNSSLGLLSSDHNPQIDQNAVNNSRIMDQEKRQERSLIGGGSELQHLSEDPLRNLFASNNRITDGLSNGLEPANNSCENQEQWQLMEAPGDKNVHSFTIRHVTAENSLEKNAVVSQVDNIEGNSQAKDDNTCASEPTAGKVYQNLSNMQIESTASQFKGGQQNGQVPQVEDEELAGTRQRDQHDCLKCGKVSSPEGSRSMHWKEGDAKFVPSNNPVIERASGDTMATRAPTDDLLADTAAKLTSPVLEGSNIPHKEQPLSDVCSKSSENLLSEFSDGGHITDEEACNNEAECKELMRNDVVDEASGIGKCCSSEGVDMGVRTKPSVSIGMDAKVQESPSSLHCPSSSGTQIGLRSKQGHKIVKLQSARAEVIGQNEVALKNVLGSGKLEKKRRKTMKWKRLDAASSSEEIKQGHPMQDAIRVEGKSTANCYAGGESAISNTKLVYTEMSLKRKRSHVKGSLNSKSLCQGPEPEGYQCLKDRETIEQRLQVKGQKLVIKLSQGFNVKPVKGGGCPKPDKVSAALGSVENRETKGTSEPAKTSFGIRLVSGKNRPLAAGSVAAKGEEKSEHFSGVNTSNIRTARSPAGRQNAKAIRMVSLSSILKIPSNSTGPQEMGVQKPLPWVPTEGVEQVEVEAELGGGTPAVHLRRIKDPSYAKTAKDSDPTSREGAKSNNVVISAKEVRKRSLWELTAKARPLQEAAQTHSALEGVVSAPACKAPSFRGISSAVPTQIDTGKSHGNNCLVPRAERSVRINLKCKRKEAMQECGGTRVYKSDLGTGYGHSIFEDGISYKLYITEPVCKPVCVSSKESNLFVGKGGLGMGESQLKVQMNDIVKATKSSAKKRDARETFVDQAYWVPRKGTEQANPAVRANKIQKLQGRDTGLESCAAGLETLRGKKFKRSGEQAFGEELVKIIQKKKRKQLQSSCVQEHGETFCCVCGRSSSESMNKLMHCNRCYVKVHQACYGVSKIPKGSWVCRPCKAHAKNIVCVLCGYPGGAMTRAKKSRLVIKGLLQAWQIKGDAKGKGKSVGLERIENTLGIVKSDCFARGESGSWHCQVSSRKVMVDVTTSVANPSAGRATYETSDCEKRDSLRFGAQGISWCSPKVKLVNGHPKHCSTAPSDPIQQEGVNVLKNGGYRVHNSVTAAADDPNATQWVHMVCALWMPGTRCLNVGTMAAFDVSGVAVARRRSVCSICKRSGGACIQCRVPKCSVPFHPWCAHEKGLLQSENVDEGGDKVGFFGRCILHEKGINEQSETVQFAEVLPGVSQRSNGESSCARTEGFKGRQSSAEYRAVIRRQLAKPGSMAVSQEQIAAWLRINERKACTRRFIKPANSDLKTDHREYLRFKQEQGWRRLAVYKSGIHALGLYTAEIINKGEMVVEYIGEIVGLRVADKREVDYHSGKRLQYQGACYLFRIDKENIIDATRKGGIARFVNHSCLPNCVAKVICVKQQKKVVFFAERDIYAGEEITYDYKFNYEKDSKIPCFCNSSNCRGYLNWIDGPVA